MRSSILFLSFLCMMPVNANAQDAKPKSSMDMVPIFVAACMVPGPDANKIRQNLVKSGGVPGPEQAGKASTDPTRLSGYNFKYGRADFSVLFNRVGTCTVVTQSANLNASKLSLDRFVDGSKSVFDVSPYSGGPAARGETVIASHVLISKRNGSKLAITLSTATREGQGTATLLSRRVVAK